MLLKYLPIIMYLISMLAIGLLMIADWSEERRLKWGMAVVALCAIAILFNQNI